jgi:pseudouridine-5'-phosphate glycosidase
MAQEKGMMWQVVKIDDGRFVKEAIVRGNGKITPEMSAEILKELMENGDCEAISFRDLVESNVDRGVGAADCVATFWPHHSSAENYCAKLNRLEAVGDWTYPSRGNPH